MEIIALGGISTGEVTLRVAPAYKHVRALVTATDSPTQDAARCINLAISAYSKVSGHVLSYKQVDLRIKLQATAASVDATLLHGCELWPPLLKGLQDALKLRTCAGYAKPPGSFEQLRRIERRMLR